MGVGTQGSYSRSAWFRALTNNSTATAFPDSGAGPIATTTEPVTVDSSTPTSNAFVIGCGYEFADLMPFGTDGANDTFDMRIVLWRSTVQVGNSNTVLWVPVHVGDINVTLGAKTGVSGAIVSNTELFADTVALAANGDSNRIEVYSPTGDDYATIRVRLDGFQKLGLYFDLAGAVEGVAMNSLVAFH